jgi:hypothetical protein
MTPNDGMAMIWRKHRLKVMGVGLLAWIVAITLLYQDVKRSQRSNSAGAEELLQIGALPVT